jgi:hypothetical protein
MIMKIYVKLFSGFLLAFLLCFNANQASANTKDLLENCEEALKEEQRETPTSIGMVQMAQCHSFLKGVYLSMRLLKGPDNQELFCPTEGTNTSMLALILVEYLEAHPDEISQDEAKVASKAMADAFPCTDDDETFSLE